MAEDELVDHYRLGDVFVMPNRERANGDTEGFGLVFLEANRCAVPVVAGCAGGSPDAVSDGVNGLVVDGRDVGVTTGAMRRLRGFINRLALARAPVPPAFLPVLHDRTPAARLGPRRVAGRAGPAASVGWRGIFAVERDGGRMANSIDRPTDRADSARVAALNAMPISGGRGAGATRYPAHCARRA